MQRGWVTEKIWGDHTYTRSAYDASYLAFAEQEGIDLITDERLFNSVKANLAAVDRG